MNVRLCGRLCIISFVHSRIAAYYKCVCLFGSACVRILMQIKWLMRHSAVMGWEWDDGLYGTMCGRVYKHMHVYIYSCLDFGPNCTPTLNTDTHTHNIDQT